MRMLTVLLFSLVGLMACVGTPVPEADPQQAWVSLHSAPGDSLLASRLDGQRLSDGRYFQVTPGEHSLEARFQFERSARGGGDFGTQTTQVTCYVRVRYADFGAGQRYRMEARPLLMKAQVWLYDDQRQVLTRGDVLRCGPY